MNKTENNFIVKPYSNKELRALYGLNYKAFRSHLRPFEEELGPLMGKHYTVKQVRLIVEKLGYPHVIS